MIKLNKLLLICFLVVSIGAFAQIDINVNTSNVIAKSVKNKYGININAGTDHQSNRASRSRLLSTAMLDIGAKHLRFPGGKKSLFYVWTSDITNPNPTTQYWTSSTYASSAKNAGKTLNFDEFMSTCEKSGAMPHINVAVDINRTEIVNETLAAEWVRYANITNNYGIKYWEIGNEMWHKDNFKNHIVTLDELVSIVTKYSNAMKAVDPTIKIGVSWKKEEAQVLINKCGSALDFYCISNYINDPLPWKDYKLSNSNLIQIDNNLSLNTVISEFNICDWTYNQWDKSNNAGKGIISFDLVGQILKNNKVDYGCMWNTRWFPDVNKVYEDSKFNGLDNQNELTPINLSWKLWSKFLKNDLVEIKNNGGLVTYASYDKITNELSVFVINKSNEEKDVSIFINSPIAFKTGEVWQYKGVNEWDTNPAIGKIEDVSIITNQVSYSLSPISITSFLFK